MTPQPIRSSDSGSGSIFKVFSPPVSFSIDSQEAGIFLSFALVTQLRTCYTDTIYL